MNTNSSRNMNLSITYHIKSVCKLFKHLILKIMMNVKIAKLKSNSIFIIKHIKSFKKLLCFHRHVLQFLSQTNVNNHNHLKNVLSSIVQ